MITQENFEKWLDKMLSPHVLNVGLGMMIGFVIGFLTMNYMRNVLDNPTPTGYTTMVAPEHE